MAHNGRKRKRTTYRKARHDAGADDGVDEEVGEEVDGGVDDGDGVGICVGVAVDSRDGELTSSGSEVPPWLSEPHDLPYPTQPSRRNFATLQIAIPPPTNSQRSVPGTAPWEGECHIRATVQRCDHTMVRCTTGTTYDVRRVRCTTGTTYDGYDV